MIELKSDPAKGIWCDDPESLEKLQKNFFGKESGGRIHLRIEEALYIITMQNGVCRDADGKVLDFNTLMAPFVQSEPRLFIKYNAYRDWRDRGLILSRIEDAPQRKRKKDKGMKDYPTKPLQKKKLSLTLHWHGDSFYAISDNEAVDRELFNTYWIGQHGIYRQERGSLLKLDFMETIFLANHFGATIVDAGTGKPLSHKKVLITVTREREYARQLYEVYEDWRLQSYVVKTGFKFGSHFRIYFPGAAPNKQDQWIHSRHVLHVFPKDQKMLVSEWARAVRVAHSVKKTFLLSIPEMSEQEYLDYPSDFIAWRRKKEGGILVRETPEDKPRYLLVPVGEDEHIGGVELASLLKKAKNMGLELILSITDRETAITYYVLKQIHLSGSTNEYYEIEWMKP